MWKWRVHFIDKMEYETGIAFADSREMVKELLEKKYNGHMRIREIKVTKVAFLHEIMSIDRH